MKAMEQILVPTDFSPGADAAAEVAAALAARLEAAVDVVTVVDTSTFTEIYGDEAYRTQRTADVHGKARTEAEQFVGRHFRGLNRVKIHVRDGDTFLQLQKAAGELGSDMIVMGTHGRTGIAHLLIGSVAEKMVRASSIPVVTVRAPEE